MYRRSVAGWLSRIALCSCLLIGAFPGIGCHHNGDAQPAGGPEAGEENPDLYWLREVRSLPWWQELPGKWRRNVTTYIVDGPESRASDRLYKAMQQPEHDELAEALARLLPYVHGVDHGNLVCLLEDRVKAGIRGEYLKMLLDYRLNEDVVMDAIGRDTWLITQYLRFYPEDREMAERFETWARTDARANPRKWQALADRGIIHKEMTGEELKALLGEPTDIGIYEDPATQKSYTQWVWYWESPRHVNPVFWVLLENDKVVRFEQGRR